MPDSPVDERPGTLDRNLTRASRNGVSWHNPGLGFCPMRTHRYAAAPRLVFIPLGSG
jgi:hypothetical protein